MDMQADCDDGGAFAVAHYLTNIGEAELIGVIASTLNSPANYKGDGIPKTGSQFAADNWLRLFSDR